MRHHEIEVQEIKGQGGTYWRVRFAGEHTALGTVRPQDGGYIAFPNRKPVPTMEKAVVQVLEKACVRREKEVLRIRAAQGHYHRVHRVVLEEATDE